VIDKERLRLECRREDPVVPVQDLSPTSRNRGISYVLTLSSIGIAFIRQILDHDELTADGHGEKKTDDADRLLSENVPLAGASRVSVL
tara:strand:- start:5093 stop:5356 length:264 start_codon:yes stop_codon:yes gene_type:complete